MKYKIVSYSGYFYVQNKETGKLLIEKSFKYWDDAKSAANKL
jgi:hypothetical protein